MTQPIEADGNIVEARKKLGIAISALIDPKPTTRQLEDGTSRIEWLDSLYDQLIDALPGGQGNASRVPQSSPPMCLDAVDIIRDIDTLTAQWEPRPNLDASVDNPQPIAVQRLQAIDKRQWRPQDTTLVEDITAQVDKWCDKITATLNPQRKWTLPNPCPACNTAVVYRKNSSGDPVRQPALQIGPLGCECQNCHTTWGPEYFQHLAKVLGYSLPQGVLE
ncbi:hypothetical protein PBI_CHE9D_104 [Mycobacterium phage Che9d]|uniref:Uncharacterized protein n=1 Tax=Mycobacterium phage Che9d TaxID=2907834 RepID=Q773R4_9CAUD|nr:hypothetical protein PBI_CHE9D_104 [Mycobacterium phage Che9d]AAR26716.1 hypothetical protein PBI_CHE9D_104 [Mycobacterium phage Che9d]